MHLISFIVVLLGVASFASPVSKGFVPSSQEKMLEEAGYFEGDMRFPKSADKNAVIYEFWRWTNAIVYYEIESSFSTANREVLMSAISAIESSTCVRFVPRTTQTNYVWISGGSSGGCWSYVGMVGQHLGDGGMQELHLQNPGCVYRGTVIHEMLHALGLFHQQSAANRDDYVTIMLENVTEGHEHNFNKYEDDYVTDFGLPYDYNSIMHYADTAFSKNGQKTIVPKDPTAQIGNRADMSTIDIQKINIMYNC